MTTLLCVLLSLLAVVFTQLRADKSALERAAQLDRVRERERSSVEAADSLEHRRQAYVKFLSHFQRQVDDASRRGGASVDRVSKDAMDDLYDALAEVRVYGTQAAADDAASMLEWLVACGEKTAAADIKPMATEAFVEHARQHLRLLAS